jgi:hypothetical protein
LGVTVGRKTGFSFYGAVQYGVRSIGKLAWSLLV